MRKLRNLLMAISLSIATVLPIATPSYAANNRGGYSQNDVTVTSGLSVENIEQLLPSPMKSLSKVLYEIEHSENPINAIFLMSIMRLETGNGSSYSYRYRNNVGGIMGRRGLRTFKTKEDSLRYMHSFLNTGYINKGRRNVWNIGQKYCVGGNWSHKIHRLSLNSMYKIPALEKLTK